MPSGAMKSVFAPVGTSCQSSSALCSLPIVLAITVALEVTKTPQEGASGSPIIHYEYTQHVSSTAVKTIQNKKARPHMRHMQMES